MRPARPPKAAPREPLTTRGPREERIRPLLVRVVAGATPSDRALERRDARVAQEEHAHERWTDERDHSEGTGQGDGAEAPPDQEVAEVVRMARVAPEAAVHHLALARRVRLEASELQVADRLEEHPGHPQRHAERVEGAEARRSGSRLRELEWERDDPLQRSLEPEDAGEAHDAEALAMAPPHRAVAVVLAVAGIAPEQVAAEAQAPEQREREDERAARMPAARREERDRRDRGEARSPVDVDDAGVAQPEAHEPEREHRERRPRRGDGEDPRGRHRRWPRGYLRASAAARSSARDSAKIPG